MNIVDSCAWLAYFADEPNAKHFQAPLKDTDLLVVPTLTIYEVFKVVLRESGEHEAIQAVAAMQKGAIADLTVNLAIAASKLSLLYNLPMADSIILATAQEFGAKIWTQDSDFEKIPRVKYYPKEGRERVGPG